MSANDIPASELFTDLQVTLTEIFLIELLPDVTGYESRLNGNCNIRDSIKVLMQNRFSKGDIINFLENGFPRKVDLSAAYHGAWDNDPTAGELPY